MSYTFTVTVDGPLFPEGVVAQAIENAVEEAVVGRGYGQGIQVRVTS